MNENDRLAQAYRAQSVKMALKLNIRMESEILDKPVDELLRTAGTIMEYISFGRRKLTWRESYDRDSVVRERADGPALESDASGVR